MKKKLTLHAARAFLAALIIFNPVPLFSSEYDSGQPEETDQLPYELEQAEQGEYVSGQEGEDPLMEEAEGIPGEEEYLPEIEGQEVVEGAEGDEGEYVPETYEEEVVPEETYGEEVAPETADGEYLPEMSEGEAEYVLPDEQYQPEIEGAEPEAGN